MSSKFRRTVRGMRDILPKDAEKLRLIEQTARDTARLHGYHEIITPIVEHYDLLAAKAGEENRQRMFVFNDLGGRQISLRPEFTASVARLVATKLVSTPKPLRLFSVGSLYRYDEPQFGRYREFWQANYELFGSYQPEADVEVLFLIDELLSDLGLKDYYFKVSHIGIIKGILTQEGVSEEKQNITMHHLDKGNKLFVLDYLKQDEISQDCIDTLRLLFNIGGKDKISITKEVIKVTANYSLAQKAAMNLREILSLFDAEGVEGKVFMDTGFARGLEYYTGMIFEVYTSEIEIALGGGGRYDNLIELFGGDKVPAVGVALGIDRISLATSPNRNQLRGGVEPKILIIPVNRNMLSSSFSVASMLRAAGLMSEVEIMGRSLSNALSDAVRREISHVVILGEKEMKVKSVVLRNLKDRSQETVMLDKLIKELKNSVR